MHVFYQTNQYEYRKQQDIRYGAELKLTSKFVSPHEHEMVTIKGQGAQSPL